MLDCTKYAKKGDLNFCSYLGKSESEKSPCFGVFNEWDANALVTQESFVYLEKSQSTPGAEGGRKASL